MVSAIFFAVLVATLHDHTPGEIRVGALESSDVIASRTLTLFSIYVSMDSPPQFPVMESEVRKKVSMQLLEHDSYPRDACQVCHYHPAEEDDIPTRLL